MTTTDFDIKYDYILRVLNRILTNADLKEIDKIEEFINVCREDITKTNTESIEFKDLMNEAFKIFGKIKIAYRTRNKVRYYILTLLKKTVQDIGYVMKHEHREIQRNNLIMYVASYSVIKKI